MTARKQLEAYGFTISDRLDKLLKKLPADSFNMIEFSKKEGVLRAKIFCDKENKTDIVITQIK